MPGVFDHLLAALLLVVWPVYVVLHGKRFLAEMDAPGGRVREFRTTMAIQWVHTALLVALWAGHGRGWADLGLGLEVGVGFYAAAVVVVLALLHQWSLVGRLRRDPSLGDAQRAEVAEVAPMIPRTATEHRWFVALAWTAGICEELAYRGFLIWYLSSWMPTWASVLVAALGFGGVHLYEGRAAAARIVLLAIVAGVLYLASGSLWIPIVLHALFDLVQLELARTILESDPTLEDAVRLPSAGTGS